MRIVALPCVCVDVFAGTGEIRPGGEALNFASHAVKFNEIEVALWGIVGDDIYGKAILESIDPRIENHVRVISGQRTASNMTYIDELGDRYYKEDSWDGSIFANLMLDAEAEALLATADVVFIHFWAECFEQVMELKRRYGFKLAVDFDVNRDFESMRAVAPMVDFFMISGEESLLHYMREMSKELPGVFNMSLGADGSVTYIDGREYRVGAVTVDAIVDTTGCGDSYHAGLVCSYLIGGDILQAMDKGAKFAAEVLSHVGGF